MPSRVKIIRWRAIHFEKTTYNYSKLRFMWWNKTSFTRGCNCIWSFTSSQRLTYRTYIRMNIRIYVDMYTYIYTYTHTINCREQLETSWGFHWISSERVSKQPSNPPQVRFFLAALGTFSFSLSPRCSCYSSTAVQLAETPPR